MFIRNSYGTFICLWLIGSVIYAEEPTYQPPQIDSLEPYAYLVDELSQRRRLQFLFQNPQSIFDGLNIGFVQVSSGNLTFQRRDLVVLGSAPVVASRIHDSRIRENTGLGPRWRFGLTATLIVSPGNVVYIDERGARHPFTKHAGAMYAPSKPSPATRKTTLALQDGTAPIRTGDGTLRQFHEVDGTGVYKLIRRVLPTGNGIALHYDKHRLVSVDDRNGVAR